MCTLAPQKFWNRDGKLPWSYVKHIQLRRKFYKILTFLGLSTQTEVQTRVQQGCIRVWKCVYVCVCVYFSLGNCNSHFHFGLKGTRVMKWDYLTGSSPEAAAHTQLSLMNSFMFIIELVILGSRRESREAPQAAHYQTHMIFHKVMHPLQLKSRKPNSKQETEQTKTYWRKKKKKENSTTETQEKCFFRLRWDWTMWTQK